MSSRWTRCSRCRSVQSRPAGRPGTLSWETATLLSFPDPEPAWDKPRSWSRGSIPESAAGRSHDRTRRRPLLVGRDPSATRSLAYPGTSGKTNYRLTLGRDFNPVILQNENIRIGIRSPQAPQPDPTTMLTGTLSSPALGWSVWKMISSSMRPGNVPDGTVTVRRYRPLRVGVSLGAIKTSTFSGLRITLKLVGRPSRTSRINWPEVPSLPLTATIRRIEGIRLIGPDAVPASTSWSLGCSGWSVATISSSRKVPRAMPGLNSRLTRYPPLALRFSSSLGVKGTGLATI